MKDNDLKLLTVQISKELLNKVRLDAKNLGLSISAYVRLLIVKGLGNLCK